MGDTNVDSFSSKRKLSVNGREYSIYSTKKVAQEIGLSLYSLPFSLRILFENAIRAEDGKSVTKKDIEAFASWVKTRTSEHEIGFYPARVLMQDFTGVPAVVDLAAMRNASKKLQKNPSSVNPLVPVDLVIDHSIQVDYYGTPESIKRNIEIEMKRNIERYQFLRWGQENFSNFRVVPPGTGICHQVNLEYLAQVVWVKEEKGELYAYPDTLVGTDSHTTMVNGLSVLGWGVGGIEAEAVMLGQPTSMIIPEVIGVRFKGRLLEGITATDLVLTVTEMLRKKGVVGKFVEFFGEGLKDLAVADRATIANMAPEYGATCGFFPIDEETLRYLRLSGRDDQTIALVEVYAKEQGLWRDTASEAQILYTEVLDLDLATVEASMAGPRRPQDRVSLQDVKKNFIKELPSLNRNPANTEKRVQVEGKDYSLGNGNVVIAAITSCTNTSNPSVMIGAGLVAKKAVERGVKVKPWVKTSLAPGSQVVTEYLEKAGLSKYLSALGFDLVGYGCTTCIGNSGPLDTAIDKVIADNEYVVASVLSGNRNFEGRIHPSVRANYLASPPLVVLYALAGSIDIDLVSEPIGQDANGADVYMKDLMPTNEEIAGVIAEILTPDMFRSKYQDVFTGNDEWRSMNIPKSLNYAWDDSSTYIKCPPYFEGMGAEPAAIKDIVNARILAEFGDSITTDHISPAGNISTKSPAAKYLNEKGVTKEDFNSYGARRGNHEVMMRGTFANTRINNKLAGGVEGGYTKYGNEVMSIYDAAMLYQRDGVPLVIFAGRDYGTGSSRDWAAKGTNLLGVRAVIAMSFERIHRSNLVGMGILPLMLADGVDVKDLGLVGDEEITVLGLDNLSPLKRIPCVISKDGQKIKEIQLICRIDTEVELEYFKNGGILHYVLRNMN